VRAAIQEDADGIAVSSYQGATMNIFTYMVDMLRELHGLAYPHHVGGGGARYPDEIAALERHGSRRSIPRGRPAPRLNGMIDDVFARVRAAHRPVYSFGPLNARDHAHIAATITVARVGEGDGGPVS